MKITVKIGTVEVIVDRPAFREGQTSSWETETFKRTVIPSLEEATKRAKELYKLQTQNPSD